MLEYYYVYKLTNLVNNKIYIGVHKSTDIDKDNYLGSGTSLLSAKLKYGESNFERVILYKFDRSECAYIVEKMIVDKDFIRKRDNYNECLGGEGGGFSPCHNELTRNKANNSRLIKYGNIHGQLHTKEARLKGLLTKKIRYSELMPGCRTKESRDKAKSTMDIVMTKKYGYNGAQMHQVGTHELSCLSKINNSIKKYPELELNCELINPEGNLIMESRVYDICEYLYSRTDAIGNRRYVTNKFPQGTFNQGKWKGYKVKLIESSTTILKGSTLEV
jgi:hypothetical protein